MTEQEKNAMLAFLGTVHAQAKQTDQMIVGQSNFVKPMSHSIQNEFAQVLSKPVQNFENNYQAPQMAAPNFIPEPAPIPEPPDEQLLLPFEQPKVPESFNIVPSELVEVLKDINLNLERIGNILQEKNKPNARNRNPKKE